MLTVENYQDKFYLTEISRGTARSSFVPYTPTTFRVRNSGYPALKATSGHFSHTHIYIYILFISGIHGGVCIFLAHDPMLYKQFLFTRWCHPYTDHGYPFSQVLFSNPTHFQSPDCWSQHLVQRMMNS